MEITLHKGQFGNPALIEFVLGYEVIRFVFSRDAAPPVYHHTPLPQQSLTFYPKEPQRFSYIPSNKIITYPRAIVNGLYTRSIYRYGGHDFLAIRVVFQPGAFFRLTGIPSNELTNTFVDAEAVWPKDIRLLSERLNSTDELAAMLTSIESFLSRLIQSSRKAYHAVDATSQLILHKQHPLLLNQLADDSCLSVRQFLRKFEERIGISPKQFDRIVRFNKAHLMRNKHPDLDWLSVALACGYYDHQHFAKDCKDLTFLSPTSFFAQNQKGPARILGLDEE